MDDYNDYLGLFQYMWSTGMISDDTYKLLNEVCDSQSFIQASSDCNKILDIADGELGNIDPYSIFTPPCPANVGQSYRLLKKMRVSKQFTYVVYVLNKLLQPSYWYYYFCLNII